MYQQHAVSQGGSIPACAGEPSKVLIAKTNITVYPRLCGGTHWLPYRSDEAQGLSPPVRGNRSGASAGRAVAGSIPACAGEPSGRVRRTGGIGVYPRLCGGTRTAHGPLIARWGLSPPVRGNLQSPLSARTIPRSIPACAGEPAGAAVSRSRDRVYPRLCGGTCISAAAWTTPIGLSPPVRGNPP